MVTALVNARLFTPGEEIPHATVILEEGRIAALGEGLPPPAGAQIMKLVALDEGLKSAMTLEGGELAFRWPKGSAP
jgi:imidazolonepropionase-like amidohydrolase